MIAQIEEEIIALHQFFQDWFNGKLPKTDESFARFTGAMCPDFHMVTPEGKLVELNALTDRLRNAYGLRDEMRIWIENVCVHWNQDALWLATYEEWQEIDGVVQSRISTVLLAEDAAAPGGLNWRHVHETFM